MSEDTAIRVDFGKPMPLFQLDGVVLLPQQAIPLHIFEPRYRQMIGHALDSSGQLALASFEGDRWKQEYHGRPPLRRAVCVANIVEHEKLPDGRYNIVVQGVCRARIIEEEPASSERLYRLAKLEPIGIEESDTDELGAVRERLQRLLEDSPLKRASAAEPLLSYLRDDDIPTHAIMELISFTLCSRPALSYMLLDEGDIRARARLILHELESLAGLVAKAERHSFGDLPKGCHWN